MIGDRTDSLSASVDERDRNKQKHRAYRYRITGLIILLCSFLFLMGIWTSGVDLDDLVWRAGMFDPEQHICLRVSWVNTTKGEADRIRLCTEWIDLSDLSGRTHMIALEDLEVVKGSDGRIRTHLQRGINLRLVTVTGYLLIIILGGRWIQSFLIHRHQRDMGLI